MTWEETVFTEEDGALQPEFMRIQAVWSYLAAIRELVKDFACPSCSTPGFLHLVIPKSKLKEWGIEREKEL